MSVENYKVDYPGFFACAQNDEMEDSSRHGGIAGMTKNYIFGDR